MSMNLYCEEVELPQTPTHITYLCYYSDFVKRKKARWQDIREKFILWYQYAGSEWGWSHMQELISVLRHKKKLTFYIM